MGSSLPPEEANLFKIIVKSYETKQYKKGLKAADTILKKFPEHGVTDVVSPGYELVIAKEGMPIAKDSQRKDNLRIKFDVKFPTRLTPEQQAGIKRILGG